jgi:hypothetical protein
MILSGTMHLIYLHIVYMNNLQGPEKINDTYRKTMHEGMMDEGSTVYMDLYEQHLHVTH